jgi:hypothetical protein
MLWKLATRGGWRMIVPAAVRDSGHTIGSGMFTVRWQPYRVR